MAEIRDDAVADSIKLLGLETERGLVDHPEPALLLAYHQRKLAPEEAAAVEEHLTWCREDAALLIDMVEALEEASEEGPASLEVSAAWERLTERLEEGDGRAEEDAEKDAPGTPVIRGRRWRDLALAASMFLAAGASIWAGVATNRLTESRKPRLNVPVQDVEPPVSQRDTPRPPTRVVLGPGRERVLLILNPSGRLEEDGSYALRILDRRDREVFGADGLELTDFGNFTVELSRSFFEPGRYFFEILSEGSVVERFAVELVEGEADADPR